MYLEILLNGNRADEASATAEALFAEIAGHRPDISKVGDDAARRNIDPSLALGVASLVLSLPGVVLTVMDIRDRLDRRRLAAHVAALKAKLEEADTDASLKLGDATGLDLRHTPTDAIVDRILKEADG